MPQTSFRPLTQEDAYEAFDLYTAAVGRVAAAWNSLHEHMAELFWRILRIDDFSIASAIWYSSYNDRSQRQMLEAGISASTHHPAWVYLPVTARDDLIWSMKRANYLGDKRDEAIHAPCGWLRTSADGTDVIVTEASGHRRAKSLIGKELLVEFDWLARYVYGLSDFALQASYALIIGAPVAPKSWPDRPRVPDRRPKKLLQDRHRRRFQESPSPPP